MSTTRKNIALAILTGLSVFASLLGNTNDAALFIAVGVLIWAQ